MHAIGGTKKMRLNNIVHHLTREHHFNIRPTLVPLHTEHYMYCLL